MGNTRKREDIKDQPVGAPIKGRSPRKEKGDRKIPIDWDTVKKLCHMQCTRDEIAGFLEIDSDTLTNACKEFYGCTYYEKSLEWREGGRCSLRRKQWLLADTSAAMGIWLGKQYLDQKDHLDLNHSGEMAMEVVNYGDKPAKPWKDENAEQGKD